MRASAVAYAMASQDGVVVGRVLKEARVQLDDKRDYGGELSTFHEHPASSNTALPKWFKN